MATTVAAARRDLLQVHLHDLQRMRIELHRHRRLLFPTVQRAVPLLPARRAMIPNQRHLVARKALDPLVGEEAVEPEVGADEIEPDLAIQNQRRRRHHHRRLRTVRHRHHRHHLRHLIDHKLLLVQADPRRLRRALRRRDNRHPSPLTKNGHHPSRLTAEQGPIPDKLPMTRRGCETSRLTKTLRN